MNRYSGQTPPRRFRKGDRVRCAGVSVNGTILIDEKYGDLAVPVQFDGTDKPSWVQQGSLAVIDKGTRAGTVRSATANKRRCPIPGCNEDHGDDGHPSDYEDEDEDAAERRKMARELRAKRGL